MVDVGEKTRDALARLREEGRRYTRVLPYGWTADAEGRLVEVEAEQETIRRAVDLRAAGLSLRAVAAALAAEGRFARNGKPFSATVVMRLVSKEITIGRESGIRQARKMPTKSQIASYWIDYFSQHGILPFASDGLGPAIDWAECRCFRCGRWNQQWDTSRRSRSLGAYWERTNLQRCHVVDRYVGGSDDVSNMVLMCRWCHMIQPTFRNSDDMFKWMREFSWDQDEVVWRWCPL